MNKLREFSLTLLDVNLFWQHSETGF